MCFIFRSLRPGYRPEEYDWRWLGHAISRDLVHWEVCSPVLGPDPQIQLIIINPGQVVLPGMMVELISFIRCGL